MSEIRVDTISEKTSANGVAVDGVTLKDGQVDLADSKKILLGTGDDLQLYHDGSHSYIQDEGTGDLKITTNGAAISLQKGTSETLAYFATDSGFNLYHDNVERIGTTAAATVFNETGVDIDFRVESNDNSGMFHINAGANHVSVGTDGDLGGVFNVSGETVMRTTGNSDTLTLVSTDADADSGPNLRLYRNSSSPADSDDIGAIRFDMRNDNSQDFIGASINGDCSDVSDGTEKAELKFNVMTAGTLREYMRFASGNTIFNALSQDLDFKVESNGNDHMFFVDGGNDHVNIGGSSDAGGLLNVFGKAVFKASDNSDNIELLTTDADANVGPNLRLYRNSSSPAVNDLTGSISFEGKDDGGNDFVTASMRSQMTGVTNGSEEGKFWIETMVAGTARQRMSIAGAETIFNEDSVDLDFRVESNGNANMLFVNGGSNLVGIGADPDLGAGLHIKIADSGATATAHGDELVIEDGTSGANVGISILCNANGEGRINFGDSDDNDIGMIVYEHDGDRMEFVASNTEILRLSSSEVCFNEGSGNIDFRVEGNGDTHLIFADGGVDRVYLGFYTGADITDATNILSTDRNEEVIKAFASNGSYGEDVLHLDCTRAGSSNYNLIRATSNGNNDSELILAGNGALNIDGTLTENGADYAEYFEWNDGNSSDEDRVGLSVKLSGNKIVASSSSDDASDIIGVISANPVIVGDGDMPDKWNQKYARDDWNRFIWEDYTVTEWTELADTLGGGEQTLQTKSYQTDKIPDGVTAPDADVTVDGVLTKTAKVIISKGAGGENLSRKKLNSAYDPTLTYIPRADRKEWDMVGIMGKLRMKKGQKTGTNWIKMRDISSDVEEWLVR